MPQRRRTHEALVAAVVAEPAMRLDPVCANGAAQFAGVYATCVAVGPGEDGERGLASV